MQEGHGLYQHEEARKARQGQPASLDMLQEVQACLTLKTAHSAVPMSVANPFGTLSEPFRNPFGTLSEPFRNPFGTLSEPFRNPFVELPATPD
jgi:hypothetical protein